MNFVMMAVCQPLSIVYLLLFTMRNKTSGNRSAKSMMTKKKNNTNFLALSAQLIFKTQREKRKGKTD